ncbi:methyltransferase domain-containing protein [Nonomuraea sp. NPDC050786]|uniref:class I SAM-dependent methyltransferase n=1 Tax=Nonomuraea sp. NPDC050786 TaxID=3154840 RepID=UPI0033E19378
MKPDENRFAFGDNWLAYVKLVDDTRIGRATESLTRALGVNDLTGLSFLDVGCGSGLFSLAAHRLGARVRAFDYDPMSVAASAELRRKFAPVSEWTVDRGSILDDDYIQTLGRHDIVYSWGVLHHTGDMWRAIDAAASLVKPEGLLYIAIYNDQGAASRLWWRLKRRYVQAGPLMRKSLILSGDAYFRSRGLTGRLLRVAAGGSPPREVTRRGMSRRHDLIDWMGGFPFEVAKPEQVFAFLRERHFELRHLTTCAGGLGCNEYVFKAPDRS